MSFRFAVAVVTACLAMAQVISGENRWALVIGNSHYQKLTPLPYTAADASLVANALRMADFRVKTVSDMVWPGSFRADEREFVDNIKPGDVCLVYYSGYAVHGSEDNYLLPVNFDPQQTHDPGYNLTRLQQRIQQRQAGLKLFLIEVATPVENGLATAGEGLAEPSLSESTETLFAFSRMPNDAAPASTQGPGVFTQKLAETILGPGMSLPELFATIRRKVADAAEHQIVYFNSNVVRSDFFFRPPPPPARVIETRTVIETKTEIEFPEDYPATNRIDRLEYVWVKPGDFKMGCVPTDLRCEPVEKPQHRVHMTKPFWLGRTEVDVNAYKRYLEKQERRLRMPPGPGWDVKWRIGNLPMVNVTWEDARAFCTWAGGRLPTEAEWEYAARSGESDQVYPLNDENSRDRANFHGRSGNDRWQDEPAPVRSFDKSRWGLFDMAGNVWEWVSDLYSHGYYAESPSADPAGPSTGNDHVYRGGSFDSDPKDHLRISIRRHGKNFSNLVGFRCVIEDTPEGRRNLQLPEKLIR
jgi:sulfatase modifying factor 1